MLFDLPFSLCLFMNSRFSSTVNDNHYRLDDSRDWIPKGVNQAVTTGSKNAWF